MCDSSSDHTYSQVGMKEETDWEGVTDEGDGMSTSDDGEGVTTTGDPMDIVNEDELDTDIIDDWMNADESNSWEDDLRPAPVTQLGHNYRDSDYDASNDGKGKKLRRKTKGKNELEKLMEVRKEKARTIEQTKAYERLKNVLPIHPADTTRDREKLSRKQLLDIAIKYINFLEHVLDLQEKNEI